MNNLTVKKGDQVVVLAGKDKGKKGTILACDPTSKRVIVKDVNMQKKNVKAKSAQQAGGIIDMEGPIDASNVMIVCPKCGKATRVASGLNAAGKKVRLCKKCGAELTFKSESAKKDKKAAAKDDAKAVEKKTTKTTTKTSTKTTAKTTEKKTTKKEADTAKEN